MSIVQNSIYTLTAKISQVISTFFVGIILARSIGPTGNGIYEIFNLVVIFSVTIGTLGLGHATVYVVKRKGINIRDVLSNTLTIGIVWGIILGFLVFIFYSVFPGIIKDLPKSALIVGSILIPLSLLDAYLIQGFLIEFRIKLQSALIVGKNFLLLLAVFFSVSLFKMGAQGIIIAGAITYILSGLVIIFVQKKIYNLILQFNRKIFKELFSFGIQNWLANIFLLMNYKFDLFLVNYYIGVEQVGFYSIAAVFASSLLLIPSSIGPLLYSSWTGEKLEKVDRLTPKITRQVVFITFIVAIFLVFFGKLLITFIYGGRYSVSYYALLLLLPGVIMMTANYVILNNFSSRGKPIYSAIILLITLVLNIIINIVVIPRYGINGAAIASSITYSLSTLFSIIAFRTLRLIKGSNNFIFASISDIMEIKRTLTRLVFKRQ